MHRQTEQVESNERRFLKVRTVLSRTGLGRSSLYAVMREGTFPASILIGTCAKAWDSLAIDAWMNARIAVSSGVSSALSAFRRSS